MFLWAVDRTCKAQHILGYVREAAGMWHVVLIFISMAGGQVMAFKRHTMANTTVLLSIAKAQAASRDTLCCIFASIRSNIEKGVVHRI